MSVQVSFHLVDPGASPPTRAHPDDAGWDLTCTVSFTLAPGERAAIPTGLAVAIPDGHAGLVMPRSGHARRHGVGVVNAPGLIDPGYRGEIAVLLINHGDESVTFGRGDRIAQLVVVAVPTVQWVASELGETERGSGGFGSSGS